MIWFLEGQASQRDVIIGAREALPVGTTIFASHRRDRPEITNEADFSFVEPEDREERLDWVIRTAVERSVKVVVAGRIGGSYEAHRAQFEDAGLVLVTGGTCQQTFDLVDNKSLFTAEAERAGLACVPAITATNSEELSAAYETLAAQGEVCIKPQNGIYGQGFWRFKDVDPFRCLANPDAREISFDAYLGLYKTQEQRPAMLVMPYMPGTECSVDMVCEGGRVIAFVGRRKQGAHQNFERDSTATMLAVKAAEHFGCDGIVNVQTRDDSEGVPHLLEINPRYSGGIGYTRATGINLPGIFATRRLGLPEPELNLVDGIRVKGITVAAVVPA
ncbi:ATP-grasp domain-containing protein [Pseudomonas saponiphila]|uniref:ATP-grasp domain-containing protein n=1 Tax=Pseudomonas saponiphila TaxID=556534 RepID=UPI00223FFFB5|nr:ATP-grasp domain-containing protein [Pseudomonas saponiphila]